MRFTSGCSNRSHRSCGVSAIWIGECLIQAYCVRGLHTTRQINSHSFLYHAQIRLRLPIVMSAKWLTGRSDVKAFRTFSSSCATLGLLRIIAVPGPILSYAECDYDIGEFKMKLMACGTYRVDFPYVLAHSANLRRWMRAHLQFKNTP